MNEVQTIEISKTSPLNKRRVTILFYCQIRENRINHKSNSSNFNPNGNELSSWKWSVSQVLIDLNNSESDIGVGEAEKSEKQNSQSLVLNSTSGEGLILCSDCFRLTALD